MYEGCGSPQFDWLRIREELDGFVQGLIPIVEANDIDPARVSSIIMAIGVTLEGSQVNL